MQAYKITIIEPFFSGSHQQWAEGWQQHSNLDIEILSLPGRYWKWRMYGGAVTLAQQFLQKKTKTDLLLVSDMLDLSTFLGLTRQQTVQIPVVAYFHENQITYPWSPTDEDVKKGRDNQYGFINYTTALSADAVFYNSNYHREGFLNALLPFLQQFPDRRGLEHISVIRKKSQTLYLGLDLQRFDTHKIDSVNEIPIILWNHRWEYDKDPETFFNTLFRLVEEGISFQLVVLGQAYRRTPPIFAKAREYLEKQIIHFGYVTNFERYAYWLWRADILPVTNQQDFFGGSVVEAIYCNNYPLLPHRLAYPEHIPDKLHSVHLYQNQEDLYKRLKDFLLNFSNKKENPTYQHFVNDYDWSTLAKKYDSQMRQLLVK